MLEKVVNNEELIEKDVNFATITSDEKDNNNSKKT